MSKELRPFVTVVSGLPRSGTSMMMQMLAAGGMPVLTDNVRQPDDDNQRGYFEYEAVKKTKGDATWLQEARGKSVKVIYALLYDLPPDNTYRVVFMNRSLDESVASQRVMLERLGAAGAAVPDQELMRIFAEQLTKVKQWLLMQPHFDVLDVDYQRVILDAEPQAQRLNEFLGGGLGVAAMVAAVDPSSYRQRLNRQASGRQDQSR